MQLLHHVLDGEGAAVAEELLLPRPALLLLDSRRPRQHPRQGCVLAPRGDLGQGDRGGAAPDLGAHARGEVLVKEEQVVVILEEEVMSKEQEGIAKGNENNEERNHETLKDVIALTF